MNIVFLQTYDYIRLACKRNRGPNRQKDEADTMTTRPKRLKTTPAPAESTAHEGSKYDIATVDS